MNDAKTTQQIVEKITGSTNVLVTVSNDPSVDALSAAIGLTVMLNKLGKHTTAIFSGATPPAITFLDPQKTFETSIDSLRDFIIALDKEKADHLRYKVEGDVVKIFITPYRTTLGSEDLEFSQGDYNVELVLALGVENQSHLDGALEAHGSILHDATVITISTATGSSSLGSIDWRDDTVSSLSEMLVTLSDLLKAEAPLIDQQVATALLTGIVAETDRFSNPKTSSKVMTIAAQLMAAGADQQLIASKLQESHAIGVQTPTSGASGASGESQASVPIKDGLAIVHDDVTSETVQPEIQQSASLTTTTSQAPPSNDAPIKIADAYALDPAEDSVDTAAPATPPVEPLLGGVPAPSPVVEPPAPTTAPEPAEEDVSKHAYMSTTPSYTAPMSATAGAATEGGVDMFEAPSGSPTVGEGGLPSAMSDPTIPATDTTQPNMESRDEASRDAALAAVSATPDASAQSFSPAPGIVLPPPPPLPDFGALPSTVAPAYALDPASQTPAPERLGDILTAPEPAPAQSQPQPAPSDPGQFQIPGQ